MPDLAQNLKFVGYALWLCFFPVFSAAAGLAVLLLVPQGTEVFKSITDLGKAWIPDGASRAVIFWLAFMGWGLANWYASRLLLMREFPGRELGDTTFIRGWRKWFPRALAVVPMTWMTAFVLSSNAPGFKYLGWWCLLATAIVGGFILGRRAFLRKVSNNPSSLGAGDTDTKLPKGDVAALKLFLALSIVLLLGLWLSNYGLARFLGAPAILMLALASITLGASVMLVFWPLRRGWPALTWIPLFLFIALPWVGLNRNHVISDRQLLREAHAHAPENRRPEAYAHFQAWLRAEDSRANGPIFLVAVAGGASRSAWWAGHTLGVLDEMTGGEFAKRTFAISGISGGSLGAATHVSLLARRHDQGTVSPSQGGPVDFPLAEKCEKLAAPDGASQPMSIQSECFLGRDFLSTTVGYLLFPDLVQRFWPFAVEGWDRSLGLETSWRKDWLSLFGEDRYNAPLMALYQDARSNLAQKEAGLRTDIPILLLNTASATTGRPVVQAPVKIATNELVDLYDRSIWPQGLAAPLATTVHNSARFPIVSPGGEIRLPNKRGWEVLVDGGYFESSGAFALRELLRAIQIGYEAQPATGQFKTEPWNELRRRIHLVLISNDVPPRGSAPHCANGDSSDSGPCGASVGAERIDQEEILTPILGLYRSGASRGEAARRELVAMLGESPETRTHCIPLDEANVVKQQPSMNWYLTPESRKAMWASVTQPGTAHDSLHGIVQALRGHYELLNTFGKEDHARYPGRRHR